MLLSTAMQSTAGLHGIAVIGDCKGEFVGKFTWVHRQLRGSGSQGTTLYYHQRSPGGNVANDGNRAWYTPD